jgi:hypothetical protein
VTMVRSVHVLAPAWSIDRFTTETQRHREGTQEGNWAAERPEDFQGRCIEIGRVQLALSVSLW